MIGSRVISSLVVLGFLLGCHPPFRPGRPDLPAFSAKTIRQSLLDRDREIRSLTAWGHGRFRLAGRNGSFDFALVAKRPEGLRIDLFSPMKEVIGRVVVCHGEPIVSWLGGEGLSIPLEPKELVEALLSIVPIPEGGDRLAVKGEKIWLKGDHYAMRLIRNGGRTLPLEFHRKGDNGYKVLFEDYEKVARKIRLEFQGGEVDLRYLESQVNPDPRFYSLDRLCPRSP